MRLNDKKEILLENNAVISGQFIDWITDKKLAFYGVDTENKISGIFTYDIESKSEENLYKINNGFVKFLKHIKDGVALVEEHYEESTMLKIVNIDGSIYLLGRVKDNNFSIYEISNDEVKRLVFDFPNALHVEKGLSVNDNGEILFVGGDGRSKNEHLYKYAEGTVTLVDDSLKTCDFINID